MYLWVMLTITIRANNVFTFSYLGHLSITDYISYIWAIFYTNFLHSF